MRSVIDIILISSKFKPDSILKHKGFVISAHRNDSALINTYTLFWKTFQRFIIQ